MNDRLHDLLAKLPDVQAMNAKIQEKWREDRLQNRRAMSAHGCARFRKANPKHMALIQEASRIKREVRMAGCENEQAVKDRVAEIKSADAHCHYCRCPLMGKNIVIDHVIPLSRGGLHEAHNLVGACHHCNSSKGNKLNWRPRPKDMWRPPVEVVDLDG